MSLSSLFIGLFFVSSVIAIESYSCKNVFTVVVNSNIYSLVILNLL